MPQKSLFDFVKGIFGGGRSPAEDYSRNAPRPARFDVPGAGRAVDPDQHNPASITNVGRTTDGRELIMTMALGTYLVDRETPTICYFKQGAVAEIPTLELRHLFECLMDKRNVGDFAASYVDLLNVASFELQARSGRLKRGKTPAQPQAPAPPRPLPRRPPPKNSDTPQWPEAENPATILRVGHSRNDAELVMTLGLGTFVLYRDPPNLKYFDRGREWDVPDMEVQLLVDALQAKQDLKEHQETYTDLLAVATQLRERRRTKRR